jgi:uncharacterized protein (TIGR02271 family)
MSPIADHPTVVGPDGLQGYVESEAPEAVDGQFHVLVNFTNGDRLWVPADALILQENGDYQLQMQREEMASQLTRPTAAVEPAALDRQSSAVPVERTQPAPAQARQTLPARAAAAELLESLPPRPATEAPAQANAAPDRALPSTHPGPAPRDEAPNEPPERVRVSRVVQTHREEIDEPLLRDEVSVHRVPVNEYVAERPEIRYEDDRIIIPVLEEVLAVEKRLLLKEEVVVTRRRTQVREPQATTRDQSEVVVEPVDPDKAMTPTAEAADREHFERALSTAGPGFDYFEPAYRFGRSLHGQRYHDYDWARLEPEARAMWERYNPGTWTIVSPAVEDAWRRAAA